MNYFQQFKHFISEKVQEYFEPTRHQLTNFDAVALCQSTGSKDEIQTHINAYLTHFQASTLILWADGNHQLNVAFTRKDQSIDKVTHLHLPQLLVNTSHQILHHNSKISLADILQLITKNHHHHLLIEDLHIPSPTDLMGVKPYINLYLNFFKQINVDFKNLCPENLDESSKIQWLNAYLAKLPSYATLLWADTNNELHLSCVLNKNMHHYHLPSFIVQANGNGISQQTINFQPAHQQTIKALAVLAQNMDLTKLKLADNQKLDALKAEVYLDEKVVSDDIISRVETLTHKIEDNLEVSMQCPICLDGYNDENPAHILVGSGMNYHKPCLEQHIQAQLQTRRDSYTDPYTNEVIRRGTTDDQIKPNLSYKSTSSEINQLLGEIKNLTKIIHILQDDNKKLMRQNQALTSHNHSSSTLLAQSNLTQASASSSSRSAPDASLASSQHRQDIQRP